MAAAVSAPIFPPRPTTTVPSPPTPTLKSRPTSLQLRHTASLPTPPPPSSPSKPPTAIKKGLYSLTCRACSAFNAMSSSRYYSGSKRSLSPGAQKIANPGRSSDGNFGSTYAGSYGSYPHDHRHSYTPPTNTVPRKTGGVIPISTEIVYKDGYAPSSSSSGGASVSRDVYSGRPRRTSDLGSTAPPPLRTRPAIVQDIVPRPSSPLSRGYDSRDGYVKSNTSVRRSEPKSTKIYSVDNSSAKLISEIEAYREPRRERGGYHLTGRTSSHRPREVAESDWSYTHPAAMYAETEPVRRPRRGSVDGRPRPTSVIDPPYSSSYQRDSRAYGPPPTTRHVEKVNELARGSSVREPVRGASRERHGSYDSYDMSLPLRSATTMPVVVSQPEHRHARDETYYRDDYRDDYGYDREPRRPTRQFTDDATPARGFGIRMPDVDDRHHGGSNSSSVEPPAPRAAYPSATQIVPYGGDALAKMPSTSEYLPPLPVVDDRREKIDRREPPREGDVPRERDRERDYDRDYERDRLKERDYERDRPRDREVERERPKDRPRDRDYERDYERDERSERHHHRRLSKEPSETSSARETARDIAVPAAAGVAGVAVAGAAIEKKRHDRKHDSDEEDRDRRSRREPPNEREDERERRYAEKDRKEMKPVEKAAVDPDEEYRLRIAQAQAELAGSGDSLTRQRSREEDPGRDRHRRREREDRDRDRRQSRDRDSRRGSHESTPPPPSTRPRARAESIDSRSEAPHNRLPNDRHVITDRNYVQEPDTIPGAYPQESQSFDGASMPPPPPPGSLAPSQLRSNPPVPEVSARSKSVDPSSGSTERRVTIVEPPKSNTPPKQEKKGILRKPTEKFPEHPDSVREGVTPLKDRLKKDGGKDIPDGAKWTKIDRRLVNPQALEEKGERFEERQDCVIVLRVLTKDEIQDFADRTNEIREEREERYNREKRRHGTSSRRQHHDDDSNDSEDNEYRHSSRRHRDDERERDREGGHRHSRDDGDGERERERERHRDRDADREKDRERERDRESRSGRSAKDYDDKYDVESEAAMRAIEDGRRGKRSDLRDEFMSAGLQGR